MLAMLFVLIRAVNAVFIAIAHKNSIDALGRIASELVGPTGLVPARGLNILVTSVSAIVLAIAPKSEH